MNLLWKEKTKIFLVYVKQQEKKLNLKEFFIFSSNRIQFIKYVLHF